MAKVVKELKLDYPNRMAEDFHKAYRILVIFYTIAWVVPIIFPEGLDRGRLWYFFFTYYLGGVVFGGVFTFFMYKLYSHGLNENLPDLFRIYDNGWIMSRTEGVWIAPFKLEWVYYLNPLFHELDKIKNSRSSRPKKFGMRILFVVPFKEYSDFIFGPSVFARISPDDSEIIEKIEDFMNYLGPIAKKRYEELEKAGSLPTASKQTYTVQRLPQYWNIIADKIGIRDIYIKETGEEPPDIDEGVPWWFTEKEKRKIKKIKMFNR